MKWVRDKTGRFGQRPHYLPEELDAECEQAIIPFLRERHGRVEFPISTDDLTVLIESAVSDLDLFADLSKEEGEVEGVTDFFRGKRPKVRISRALSEAAYMENRLRTTLTHEFAHVRFHGFMFEIGPATLPLFPVKVESHLGACENLTTYARIELTTLRTRARLDIIHAEGVQRLARAKRCAI